MASPLCWELSDDGARFGDFLVRPHLDKSTRSWRLFYRGVFVFSASDPERIEAFVIGKLGARK